MPEVSYLQPFVPPFVPNARSAGAVACSDCFSVFILNFQHFLDALEKKRLQYHFVFSKVVWLQMHVGRTHEG